MKIQPTILATAVAAALGISAAAQATAPCAVAAAYRIPCDPLTVTSVTPTTPPGTWIVAPWVLPALGSTPATVTANFSYIQVENFTTNPHLDAMFTAMTPDMLARLSTEMHQTDPGNSWTPRLLEVSMQKLSAANLRRLQGAFGSLKAYTAYASAATLDALARIPVAAPLPTSAYWYASKGNAAPVYSSGWLYELFLDQYTSTLEAADLSLRKSMVYAQWRMKINGLDVPTIMGAVGLAFTVVSFFDPNAWADLKTWVGEEVSAFGSAAQGVIVTPYPAYGSVGFPGGGDTPDPSTNNSEVTTPGGPAVCADYINFPCW
jgi:hypothetical protein